MEKRPGVFVLLKHCLHCSLDAYFLPIFPSFQIFPFILSVRVQDTLHQTGIGLFQGSSVPLVLFVEKILQYGSEVYYQQVFLKGKGVTKLSFQHHLHFLSPYFLTIQKKEKRDCRGKKGYEGRRAG